MYYADIAATPASALGDKLREEVPDHGQQEQVW